MSTLQVNTSGLAGLAGRCGEFATDLAGISAPTIVGPTGLVSAAVVTVSHSRVDAVVAAAANRMRSTALRLTSAAGDFDEQQTRNATVFDALSQSDG